MNTSAVIYNVLRNLNIGFDAKVNTFRFISNINVFSNDRTAIVFDSEDDKVRLD